MTRRAGTGRTARCAVAALAACCLTAGSTPAHAASVGGVDLRPVPAVVGGEPVTSFRVALPERGERSASFSVRNTTDEQRTARLYAVGAVRKPDGGFSLRDDASPFVALPEQELELDPGELVVESFSVSTGDRELPATEQYAAVVLEVRNGSVVQRVATVVYLKPDPAVPLPVLLVIAAGVLAVLVGAAVLLARRRTA